MFYFVEGGFVFLFLELATHSLEDTRCAELLGEFKETLVIVKEYDVEKIADEIRLGFLLGGPLTCGSS